MTKIIFSLALVLFSFVSSAQVLFTATNGENIQMKARNATKEQERTTRVYFEEKNIPDSLENIGILTVNEKHRAVAIEKAKIYAARTKGTAVFLDETNDRTTADKIAGSITGNNRKFSGMYVFYVYRPKTKSN